jgi:hypothetical protein
VWLDLGGLPDELRRRLLLRAIGQLMPSAQPRGPALMRLMARLDSGGAAALAGVKVMPDPGLLGGWRLRLARKRRDQAVK